MPTVVNLIRFRRRAWAVPGAAIVAALALSGPVAAAPAHSPTLSPYLSPAPVGAPQGIIMSDGNICDPIRWGC